ncbi:1-acyl-sn-glycerol-3-phosphate acyltransferase [Flavobacterium litorale]|uniref:1-acyl-sn-glycerol-3-phosphate acyltransferase n=2 Tax=Flavobacterium litorale TaxID=2856519 RepID=A0ABX8VAG1_9FLAO|nr:1-acyl-sn-glycerol-3-phosphate acyltransferase [Flavobacterium litorale]
MGWRIKGFMHPDVKKCIIIVVSHTSWTDFIVGVFTRGIIGLEMNFVAKKELFVFPFGVYFKWMGGTPLNRQKTENKVDAIAAIFDEKEVLRLAIAPEGTRKKVVQWKTGFYYIALKANVPIVPVAFNYAKKEVNIAAPYYLTGNKGIDFTALEAHYKGVKGYISANSYEPK